MFSKRTKEILDIFISALTLCMTFTLSMVFITAFLSPDMKTTVTINEYNEAYIELPIIILIFFGAIRNLYRQFLDLERV